MLAYDRGRWRERQEEVSPLNQKLTGNHQDLLKTISRSSHWEVFLGKGVLQICITFTGEHQCRNNVISIKLLCNFIEITLQHGCSPVSLLHIFRTSFRKNTSGWLLLPLFKNYCFSVLKGQIIRIRFISKRSNSNFSTLITFRALYTGVILQLSQKSSLLKFYFTAATAMSLWFC